MREVAVAVATAALTAVATSLVGVVFDEWKARRERAKNDAETPEDRP